MPTLDSKVDKIPRIGIKYAKLLERLNIRSVKDLLFHFPFRYEDYSERISIVELSKGQSATIMGEITHSKLIRTWKKKMLIVEASVQDDSGTIRAVWFNQPYISDSLVEGKAIRLSGKVSADAKGLYFSNPAWEFSSREPTNTGRLVPIYPETEGVTSKWLRWQIQNVLNPPAGGDLEITDPIPESILSQLHLPPLQTALAYIHFPQNEKQYVLAQKRFAFQNMLIVQIAALRMRNEWQTEKAVSINVNDSFTQSFFSSLPFPLTNAQQKACKEIFSDLSRPIPMNRLLNGDVGSGKTIVAASACAQVANAQYQAVIMAPTEVLARQHYLTISSLLKNYDLNIALLTNAYKEINNFQFPTRLPDGQVSNFQPASTRSRLSTRGWSNLNVQNSNFKIDSKFKTCLPVGKVQNSKLKSEGISRNDLLSAIKTGNIDIIIGTHALIQKDVAFHKLALIVVDEQHRFGVQQRAFLQQEAINSHDGIKGKVPHLLTMTATPIPRTLALAFFGNLDLSVLDEMPKNRKPIKTEITPNRQREKVYDFVRSEIAADRQAFVILPLVEESEALSELKAATTEHKRLSQKVFPDLKLGLLHGKLKSSEKEQVMSDFKDRKYDILVATSVVEVGIDVPNATVIIIEDADRFGLSQLHQFRGRVGRGEFQSHCFLLTNSSTQKARQRLGALVKSTNGFELAEEDLKLRGPGEFLGTRQSGVADIAMQHIANVRLIEISKRHAEEILQEDPALKRHVLLKKELERFSKTVHLE